MSTSSKGKAVEREVKKRLEAEGWLVEKSVHTMWCRRDFFERFDLICKMKNKNRYIQIKYIDEGRTHGFKYHLDPIIEFAKQYSSINESYELWIKTSARWVGRGKEKKFEKAKFHVYYVNSLGELVGDEEFYA